MRHNFIRLWVFSFLFIFSFPCVSWGDKGKLYSKAVIKLNDRFYPDLFKIKDPMELVAELKKVGLTLSKEKLDSKLDSLDILDVFEALFDHLNQDKIVGLWKLEDAVIVPDFPSSLNVSLHQLIAYYWRNTQYLPANNGNFEEVFKTVLDKPFYSVNFSRFPYAFDRNRIQALIQHQNLRALTLGTQKLTRSDIQLLTELPTLRYLDCSQTPVGPGLAENLLLKSKLETIRTYEGTVTRSHLPRTWYPYNPNRIPFTACNIETDSNGLGAFICEDSKQKIIFKIPVQVEPPQSEPIPVAGRTMNRVNIKLVLADLSELLGIKIRLRTLANDEKSVMYFIKNEDYKKRFEFAPKLGIE